MSSTPIVPRRVLVTGSGGMIGQAVCEGLLARGHHVRGFDRRPTPAVADAVVGDLTDPRALIDAAEGMDSLIHLAATPDVADFVSSLMPANVLGLYHACEAARIHKLRRLVLVSTGQVASGLEAQGIKAPYAPSHGVAPTNLYALTKVWAEEMGKMYARVHKIPVLAVRPGYLPRTVKTLQGLHANPSGQRWYISPADTGLFFGLCVEVPFEGFASLFATSRPPAEALFDLADSKAILGYDPRDTFPQGIDEAVRLVERIAAASPEGAMASAPRTPPPGSPAAAAAANARRD